MSNNIHTGFWTNWSQGKIYGATLTLSQRDGVLLLAAAAAYVAFLSTKLWRILVFIVHQIRATPISRDGLFHQQQVILRNSDTAGIAAWQFLLQSFFWTGKARFAILRTCSLATVCLCYLLVSAAAAIYSSDISKAAGDTRLLAGQNCGYWTPDQNASEIDQLRGFQQKQSADLLVAKAYQSRCYGEGSDLSSCDSLPQRALNWTVSTTSVCPFASGICSDVTFQLSTGLLDTFYDFGINSAPDQRLMFQKVMTCSPLKTDGYSRTVNAASTAPTLLQHDKFLHYYYGVYGTTNWTFEYNLHDTIAANDYTVFGTTAYVGNFGDMYTPISALKRADADVTIVFVAQNHVMNSEPCDDPIFAAHRVQNYQGIPFYLSDRNVSALGCTEQYRICNPNNGGCSVLNGVNILNTNQTIQGLGLNAMQTSILKTRVVQAAIASYVQTLLLQSNGALLAQQSLYELLQIPLPANQWMLEVSWWFTTGLAWMQHAVQDFVAGGTPYSSGFVFIPPGNDTMLQAQCQNQMIRDSESTLSFSVLGLCVLGGTGWIILFVYYTMEPLVGGIQRRFNLRRHAYFNWLLDDVLQLQRIAYQAQGWGTWTKSTSMIPTTIKGEKFGGWAELHDKHEWIAPTPRSSISLYSRSNTNMDKVSNVEGRKSMDILVSSDDSSIYSNWRQAKDNETYQTNHGEPQVYSGGYYPTHGDSY